MTDSDELEYVTCVDVNVAILREIAKIRFKERLPRIMESVAEQLMAAGVDFSKAHIPDSLELTEADWDAIYKDL